MSVDSVVTGSDSMCCANLLLFSIG